MKHIILSGAHDCTIRAWTINGQYIGIFGQENLWTLDSDVYLGSPTDIVFGSDVEEEKEDDED